MNETSTSTELVEVRLDEVGEHYGRFRLHSPEAERAMARSLVRWGQLSPVVVCVRQGAYELVDGFKRLGAVRSLDEWERLAARVMEADDKAAKAAMYGLNRVGARPRSWRRRGSSTRWCARTVSHRSKSPSFWAVTRRGCAVV